MKTKDMLGCVGGAALFLFVSAWIPFVGPFFSLLTPLPFLYYSTKLGFYSGVKLGALALLVIGLIAHLMGYPQIALFGFEFTILGLVLSELFRRRFSLGQAIFLATFLMLVLGMAFLFFFALSKNMGPFEILLNYLEGHLRATMKVYQEMGMTEENARELEAYGRAFIDTISRIYPSLMIIGTGFAVWLNVVLAKPLFRMGNLIYPSSQPMDRWQAPERLVWVVIAAGFSLFLSLGSIKWLAVNALIVTMAIYFFHGLSIVLFFLNKYHVPSWMRIGLYFLIIVQQLFMAVLALAGLFDQWIDFRKIHKRSGG